MNLLLLRHAEAEDGVADFGRELTARGRKQASHIAKWLERHAPDGLEVLASPTARTVQTAEALGREFTIAKDLGPGASVEHLLRAAHWPKEGRSVLIVGHQPTLGRVASLVLTGTEQDWSIKKGALWWIAHRERDGGAENLLRAVIPPDLA